MSSKYRSRLESTIGETLDPLLWAYEPFKVHYPQYKNYTPDFVLVKDSGMQILVEVKGWFRIGDTAKYKAIGKHCNAQEDMEFVFFLQHPHKKVRKGAQITMAEWCEKNDMRWFSTVEELIALEQED